jgi:predicted RNA-binding protein (TIGR00451 family)
MDKPTFWELRRIRGVAGYQLGNHVGKVLFPDSVRVTRSPRTGKVKLIYLRGQLLATLRSHDGLLSLNIQGARRILRGLGQEAPLKVVVKEGFEDFAKSGRNLFAKHVLSADPKIRSQNEAIVTDVKGRLVAVGRAILSGEEMICFKLGVAVKVRRGIAENKSIA